MHTSARVEEGVRTVKVREGLFYPSLFWNCSEIGTSFSIFSFLVRLR